MLWKFSARPADKEKIELATIFGDNMVLQRDSPISIWGKGTPQDRIQICLGKTKTQALVGSDGCWTAVIPPLKAGGPYNLTVGGFYHITLHNVYVGDVWLCAGQSNMAMSLYFSDPAEYKSARIDSQKRAQTIRFFQVHLNSATEQMASVTGSWLPINRVTIPTLSAVGYHFAREIEEVSNVPIGIVQCAASYLPIKSWISSQALGYPPKRFSEYTTSSLYNGMIAPLCDFPIKGVVWYQGESDVYNAAEYKKLLTILIDDWRKRWKRSLPFLIVQLPGCTHSELSPSESPLAELREAQLQVSQSVPNTYLIISIDTAGANPGLHPPYKQEIGHRLARTALSAIYKRNLPFQVPCYRSMHIQGNKIEISFFPADARFFYRPKIEGFTIAGQDKKFYSADTSIQNNQTILASSPQVPRPIAVRYAWADNPGGNLYGSNELPVSPFRTDSWSSPITKRSESSNVADSIHAQKQDQLAKIRSGPY
jgi:sialate O-acetylesterase